MQLLVTHMAVADHLPPNPPLWGKVLSLNLFLQALTAPGLTWAGQCGRYLVWSSLVFSSALKEFCVKKQTKNCQTVPGSHETLILNWPLLNTPTESCQFIIEWFILDGKWSSLLIRITVQSLFLTRFKLDDYLIKCWLAVTFLYFGSKRALMVSLLIGVKQIDSSILGM